MSQNQIRNSKSCSGLVGKCPKSSQIHVGDNLDDGWVMLTVRNTPVMAEVQS